MKDIRLKQIECFEIKEIKEFHNLSSMGLALVYGGVSVTMKESMTEFAKDLKFYTIDGEI